MARGNTIIVNSEPTGRFVGGYIGAGLSPKPGTILQIDGTVDLRAGRPTFKLYDRGASGDAPAGPLLALLEDNLQGKSVTTAYAAGDYCLTYTPQAADELNLIVADVTGTGDSHAAGELLMVEDGTGKLLAAPASVANPDTAATLSATVDATATLQSGTYFATYTWKKGGQSTLLAPTQAAGQAVVSGTNKLTLTIPAAPSGTDGVDVYLSTAAAGPYFRVRTDVTPATTIHVSAPITAAMYTAGPPSLNGTDSLYDNSPFELLETITSPTADTLAWVTFNGG